MEASAGGATLNHGRRRRGGHNEMRCIKELQ